ncbi:HWE histidine kinase domain-containing protein [Sphingomonas natans]|uniref:HWE histidine kinase domain-containing protein n=1 Tax=Sphingomonas natans TaxID=3063330 RepID=UPI0026E2B74F|nr:HWE histidine kinase domain-containing protein [Sphingomonas sp. BIUV-7]
MPDSKSKTVEQRAAEGQVANFQRQLGPFVVAAETTRMAMAFTDATAPGEPIIFANEAFFHLTGYPCDEVLAQPIEFFFHPDSDGKTLAEIAAACHGHEGGPDIRYRRKNGSGFWASTFVSRVFNAAGETAQHFISLADNTKHHQERERCYALIDELNHRVKNTLSTVQSIVSQASKKANQGELFRDAVESRIFALSRSHDLLARVSWDGVAMHDLVTTALEPFRPAVGDFDRTTISGPDFQLSPRATIALGIAFHELATNATKYGAFHSQRGSLAVSWDFSPLAASANLRIRWAENDGPPVAKPTQKGFGSQVLERGLAHELGGKVTLEYKDSGLVCLIEVPAHGNIL